MEYLGVWGRLIHEKNLKSKISCQTPFNDFFFAERESGENSEDFCSFYFKTKAMSQLIFSLSIFNNEWRDLPVSSLKKTQIISQQAVINSARRGALQCHTQPTAMFW